MTVTPINEGITVPKRFEVVQFREAEVVDADEDGVIRLRAVPYGVETELGPGLYEQFEPKSLERAANAPSRVKLLMDHRGQLVGCGKDVEDRPDGLYTTMRFAKTVAAEEARSLAMDGFIDQCSVEFRPMKDHMKVQRRGGSIHVRHSRAHLLSVALVAHGAYEDNASVLSVRDNTADREHEQVVARLRSLTH